MDIDPNTSPLISLALLSIFHVVGGVAMGLGLRSFMDDPVIKRLPRLAFPLIWGGMFGCIPLAVGAGGGPLFLLAQLTILAVAIGLTYYLRDAMREAFSNSNITAIAFGGIFMLAGMFGGYMFLFGDSNDSQPFAALIFTGMFGLAGGVTFWRGVKGVFDDEDIEK